jgi:streptogramin lyase
MSNHFKQVFSRWLIVVGIVTVGLVVVLSGVQSTAAVQAQRNRANSTPSVSQPGFIFRFDSNAQTFFTVTLPSGGLPQNVIVSGTNPTHVWATEPGRNQLVHLVYTDTTDFWWAEYPVTSTPDSRPFRLTIDGNFVWFTERSANRLGRLNAVTGQIDEFYDRGLSPNAGLADIKIAPDGKVWTTAQWSNRLVQLTITSTADYAFREYTNALLISPFGLAIESSDAIWVASSGAHEIARLMIGSLDHVFLWSHLLPKDSVPLELVHFFVNTGKPHHEVWFSDVEHDQLGKLYLSTATAVEYFGPITRATSLASESPTVFWLTQQDRQGAVARFTYTDYLSSQIDSYPLPTSGLLPTGIAVATDHGVWLTAYTPNRVYLPTTWRN